MDSTSRKTTDIKTLKRLKRIGDKLREIRLKEYTSHEKFANKHDLSRTSYGRMERGENITLKSLITILDIHKVSLEEFFKGIK